MSGTKPDAFELFCRYNLGLDADLRPRFYNLSALAREYGVSPAELEGWLQEASLSAEITTHTDFSVAKAHGEAQVLALTASPEEVRDFARKAFKQLTAALATYDPERFRDGTDWDRIWADEDG